MSALIRSREKWVRRLFKFIGGLFIALSVLSMMVSIPMPGMGWLLAGVSLIMASLLSPLIGRRCVIISFGICVVHLFTFGPLSGSDSLGSTSPITALLTALLFVGAPFAVAIVPILAPVWRRMRHPQ